MQTANRIRPATESSKIQAPPPKDWGLLESWLSFPGCTPSSACNTACCVRPAVLGPGKQPMRIPGVLPAAKVLVRNARTFPDVPLVKKTSTNACPHSPLHKGAGSRATVPRSGPFRCTATAASTILAYFLRQCPSAWSPEIRVRKICTFTKCPS